MRKRWLNLQNMGLALVLAVTNYACVQNSGTPDPNNTTATQPSTSAKDKDPNVIVHNLGDPDKLNPLTSSSADAQYIQSQIFAGLLTIDPNPNKLDLVPYLAVARPEIKEINEGAYAGGMSLSFEIHSAATWDDGSPVTGHDYAFTIKAVKNPKVNAGSQRPYLEFIDEIVVDANNPKKFTIFSKERYFLAESSAGTMTVLPEYVYDASKLMRKFTVPQLDDPKMQEKLSINPDINAFATEFNGAKFDRDVVVGCGAYTFKSWETGQYIELERKKDWWGDKVTDNPQVKAYAPKIIYKVVNDVNTAVVQLENQELDVMVSIKPESFVELKEKKDFTRVFDLSTPDQYSYLYLGFNTKNPKYSDKKVRRAFAHLINRDVIIESLYQGLATKTNSPVNPKKSYYNKDLADIEFSPEKAKALLAEAGWKDTNGNGIIDKVLNGKLTEMKVVYKFNQGNNIRKNIGLLLQEEAKRVGIEVTVEAREWTVFLEDTKKRDFEIVSLAWVQSPSPDDFKQIWHTGSDTPDGSNRVGFGNKESDQIIDKIRVTLDSAQRDSLYKKIQAMIYDEQPYVFICVPSERIAIHKRFEGRETTPARPGFSAHMLRLKEAK